MAYWQGQLNAQETAPVLRYKHFSHAVRRDRRILLTDGVLCSCNTALNAGSRTKWCTSPRVSVRITGHSAAYQGCVVDQLLCCISYHQDTGFQLSFDQGPPVPTNLIPNVSITLPKRLRIRPTSLVESHNRIP